MKQDDIFGFVMLSLFVLYVLILTGMHIYRLWIEYKCSNKELVNKIRDDEMIFGYLDMSVYKKDNGI